MMSQGQQQQQQEQVIHLLLSRAAIERQVSGRLTSQPQQQAQAQQQQQEEQVIRLLVSRAASERQVSGRLTSQPDARGGRSGGDEGCGSMGGTMRAPRDAGETRRASLTSGAGSGTSSRGASGGTSGTSGGASSPGELLALGLYSVPEEKQPDFKSFLLSQTGHHRPGLLSDFGGIAGWVAANGAQRKASAGTPKEKVMSHLPHHSPPAYRPSHPRHPAHRIPLTAHRTPHTPHAAHRTSHSKSDSCKGLPSCPLHWLIYAPVPHHILQCLCSQLFDHKLAATSAATSYSAAVFQPSAVPKSSVAAPQPAADPTPESSASAAASTNPAAAAAVPKAVAKAVAATVAEPPPVTALGPDTGATVLSKAADEKCDDWYKVGKLVQDCQARQAPAFKRNASYADWSLGA